VLLSNPNFVASVKERYILAWDSVRPAPKVSIDFGDGKKLTRTLKGSTVFYVCRSDAKVVDIFPGIYTPADFIYLESDSQKLLVMSDPQVRETHQRLAQAPFAAAISFSKGVLESPVLAGLSGIPANTAARQVGLDDLSRHPLTRKHVISRAGLPPDATGEQIVAADSARYRKMTRPAVESFLAKSSLPLSPGECTTAMFKDVLNVPIDDPYLGLGGEQIPGTP
jgi:hypothetical protein